MSVLPRSKITPCRDIALTRTASAGIAPLSPNMPGRYDCSVESGSTLRGTLAHRKSDRKETARDKTVRWRTARGKTAGGQAPRGQTPGGEAAARRDPDGRTIPRA